MSSIPQDEVKAEFVRLRVADPSAPFESVLAAAKKNIARASREKVSKGEALVRGGMSGASMDLDDEIGGAVAGAIPAIVRGEPVGPAYRAKRDELRTKKQNAQEDRPVAYGGAQIAGGIGTALVPGLGAAKGAMGALKLGAVQGAVQGLGSSEADLTEGDIGGAVADTAIGGTIGAVAGPLLHGLGAGAKGVANVVDEAAVSRIPGKIGAGAKARAVSREAGKAAKAVAKGANEPSLIGVGRTVGEVVDEGDALEKGWSKTLGERVRLRPSQKTGDPEAALSELRARNFPATMKRAQGDEQKLLDQGARILDEQVKRIAADPTKLGRSEVGEGLLSTIERYGDDLEATRSAWGARLYDDARKAGGGVDAEPILAAVRNTIKESGLDPTKTVPQLKSILDKLEHTGAGGGFSVDEVMRLRSYLGRVKRRKANMLTDAPDGGAGVAKRLLAVIDSTLDDAAETAGSADGVRLFREANAYWREATEEIESTATETIKKILGTSGDATDTITKRLNSASEDQIRGVFRLLNKAEPEQAQQLRAQMLDDWLVTVGQKPRIRPPAAGEDLAKKIGASELRPGALFGSFHEMAPRLEAAFEGDNKARMALKETAHLISRLSFGPKIRGSTTAPQAADALKEAFGSGAETAAGLMLGPAAAKGVAAVVGPFTRFARSAEMAAEAMTSREGIQAFNGALRLALDERAGKAITPKQARAVTVALTRAGINLANRGDKQEDQQ